MLLGEHGVGDLVMQTLGHLLALQVHLVEGPDLLGARLALRLGALGTFEAEVVDVLALLVVIGHPPIALGLGPLQLEHWWAWSGHLWPPNHFVEEIFVGHGRGLRNDLVLLESIDRSLLPRAELADRGLDWRLGLVHEDTLAFLVL